MGQQLDQSTTKEILALREHLAIHNNFDETERKYKKKYKIFAALGLTLAIGSLVGGGADIIQDSVPLLGCLFGGLFCGVAYLYKEALFGLPLIKEYTQLDEYKIQSRIEQLSNSGE